jgi:hypothetical protein
MSEGSSRLRCATAAALAVATTTAALAAAPPGGAAGAAAAAHPDAAALGKPAQVGPTLAKSPGPSRGEPTARGVVQSVSARAVVLKELDGSSVSVPVDATTRVFVDGKPASLGAVKPGFLVVAKWVVGKVAQELQAFDLNAPGFAVVESVSAHAVVVKEFRGSTVTIPVNAKTRVFVDGKPASLRDVKRGYYIVVKGSKGNKPARELRFLRPG